MEAKRTALRLVMACVLLVKLPSLGNTDEPAPKADGPKPAGVPDKWSRVDVAGKFTLRLPPEMAEEKVRGIDSLVRKYRSGTITLSCDYGRYSDPLRNDGTPNYKKTKLSVGDRSAHIVTYGQPDGNPPLVAAIHFPDLTGDKKIRLTVVAKCKDAKSQEVALQILKAITFP